MLFVYINFVNNTAISMEISVFFKNLSPRTEAPRAEVYDILLTDEIEMEVFEDDGDLLPRQDA